uniref:Putative high mobility group box domain-containing protein n=1 Tax=Helianthus annuus TaxID=4232 RepID=A0A251T134_HELAN
MLTHDRIMKGGKSTGAQKKSNAKLAVKKGKPAKDPNKPKRPASAFFVFMEEFRKQFKAENPDNKSVAAVGKAGGVKWKAMSTSEKAPYVAKAEKRKAEYEKTMVAYNKKQASGVMMRLAVKKGKAAKDPNKPKRPASAFFVFMEDFRKQFKAENPDNKSVAAVGKAGGAKWKAMSTSEQAPYVAKAEKRKAEYEKTMVAYNKKQAMGGKDEDDDSDKSKSEVNNEEDSDDEVEDDD